MRNPIELFTDSVLTSTARHNGRQPPFGDRLQRVEELIFLFASGPDVNYWNSLGQKTGIIIYQGAAWYSADTLSTGLYFY